MRYAIKERRFPFHVESGSCWRVSEAKTRRRRCLDALEITLKLKFDLGSILAGFSSQHGFPNRRKSKKNRSQDPFHFGIYFLTSVCSMLARFLKGFWPPKWSQFGIKINENSMLTLKCYFSRKQMKTNGCPMFF